ncbi:MAG: tetratricopeptide repeat protein [Verrucomicrobiaceae bacterium]|nr:tetratricopeptide repeat protein [Verrucomicrobiaceae bacterium]
MLRTLAQDAGTVYLEAYLQVEDAEKLELQGNFSQAHRKYSDAKNILDTIARNHRDWRPEVLTYRRRKVNEAIERCRLRLPKAGTQGVAQGTPPVNPANVNVPRSLLDQKDAHIRQLEAIREQLLVKLQATQADFEKTRQNLQTSQNAHTSLTQELGKAREALKELENQPEEAKRLKDSIERLNNELAIASDSLTAADQKIKQLTGEKKTSMEKQADLQAQCDELLREKDRMSELLKASEDKDIQRLLSANMALSQELSSAKDEIQKLTGEKKRDTAQIAALRERLAGVEQRLADIQKENSEYQQRIAGLSSKLRDTEGKLKEVLADPESGNRIAEAALTENEALRAIVKRQIMLQAWRKQAKELVLAELNRHESVSQGLVMQIEKLAEKGTVLTPSEQELLKDSLLGGLGGSGLIIQQGGTAPEINYPEITADNSGKLTSLGLNENLTDFARAIASDFARGNYLQCEQGYTELLKIVPDNVYSLRNMGIIKMRLNKGKEAEMLFNSAIKYNPEDDYSHFILGVYYYRNGLNERAVKSIDQGLQIAPNNAKAHHYLGAIFIERGLRERAREEFQRVIAIDPTFGDAYYNLAYLYVTDSPPQLVRARNFYLEAQKNGTAADPAMDRKLGT